MLNTDANTISIPLPSPPLPQPVSQRHPQINPCAETNAEETTQSQDGPGQAVRWEEPFLLFQAQQCWLYQQLARRGQCPGSARAFLLGTTTPSPICSNTLAPARHRAVPMAPPAPAPYHPKATQAFPQESRSGSILLCHSFGRYPAVTRGVSAIPRDTSAHSVFPLLSLALPNLLLARSINVKGCRHAFSQPAFQMTNQQY